MKSFSPKPSPAAVLRAGARFVPDAYPVGLGAEEYLSRFGSHEKSTQKRVAQDLDELNQRLAAHTAALNHGLSPSEPFVPCLSLQSYPFSLNHYSTHLIRISPQKVSPH